MSEERYETPTVAELKNRGESPEVLFWVGCAGSFDDRYKRVTRAFVKILHAAKIRFAVLGTEETCTGDPARRARPDGESLTPAARPPPSLHLHARTPDE